MRKSAFKVGDLVMYSRKQFSKQPSFMLWHRIQPDGRPSLEWHPYRWRVNDVAVILEKNGEFLKILKSGGGVGWLLAAWCEK